MSFRVTIKRAMLKCFYCTQLFVEKTVIDFERFGTEVSPIV